MINGVEERLTGLRNDEPSQSLPQFPEILGGRLLTDDAIDFVQPCLSRCRTVPFRFSQLANRAFEGSQPLLNAVLRHCCGDTVEKSHCVSPARS